MRKKLQIWNGRAQDFQGGTAYVAAYTQKQAVECLRAAFQSNTSLCELNKYFFRGSWGNAMNGITPIEPCVYVQRSYDKPVYRIFITLKQK